MKITRTNPVYTTRALTSPVANPFKDGRRDGPDWVPVWTKGTRFVLYCYTETQVLMQDSDGSDIEQVITCSEIRPQGGYNRFVRYLDSNDKIVSNKEQAALNARIVELSEPVSDFDALITICSQDNVDPKELLRSMWNRGIVGPHTIEQARLETLERWDAEEQD